MDLEIVRQNLEKRHFKAKVFETASLASEYLNNEINNTTVGIGGSVTINEMGLFDSLSKHNEVFWHNHPEQVKELGAPYIRDKASNAYVYISSVNGLSADGQIINIDGFGNRIASTAYGHKKLYFVVGKNKLADTFESAMWRARNIAAPKNAQRLGLKTPCAIKGDKCYNCAGSEKICRGFMIMEAPLTSQETEVILINENLGY